MRETYELEGVPLVIDFVPRTGYRGPPGLTLRHRTNFL